ncbi:MAG: glycosyltransferase family 9 protein [Vicinamibacterales bacterium]
MNILLVRLRLIGDVVFTTPAIRGIRDRFPSARLTYLVEPSAAPVVVGNPLLDEVLIVPYSHGLSRLATDARLIRELRRRRFDLVLDFHGGPRSSLLAWASGAPSRVGYAVTGRGWMYTRLVPRARTLEPRHSVENQWDLLSGIDGAAPTRPAPVTHPTTMVDDAPARDRVEAWLRARALDERPLIVLHVSAGNAFRRWPTAHFAALVAALAARGDRGIIITAGPSDREAADAVRAAAALRVSSSTSAPIVTADDLGLAELRALIARASLFIGGDSGPLHLASTTTTPIVGLYGPTLPERSGPWRDPAYPSEAVDGGPLPCRPCHQRHCVPGDFRCLTSIRPEHVLSAAERALARPLVAVERHPA